MKEHQTDVKMARKDTIVFFVVADRGGQGLPPSFDEFVKKKTRAPEVADDPA
jgi:hypothetical protein